MHYVELVALIAVIQFFAFGALTGRARRESGLKAPAVTGHEGFERMYRVQMNTLETLVAFLPALFLAGKYWPPLLVAGLGVIYLLGRHLYWRGYVAEPSKRGLGFMLSMFATLFLLLLALVGIGLSLSGRVLG
jgi:glutathione S-transferase